MEALSTLILYHIPEACLFTAAGLGIVGFKTPLRRLLTFGLAFGIIVQVVRTGLFPWHIPVLALLQVIAQRYYFRISWVTSVGAVFVSLILTNLGEALLALVVFPLLSLSAEEVFNTPVLYIVMGWVTLVPLLVAALGSHRWSWVIIPLHGDDRDAGASLGNR